VYQAKKTRANIELLIERKTKVHMINITYSLLNLHEIDVYGNRSPEPLNEEAKQKASILTPHVYRVSSSYLVNKHLE
jgi:hypothetical protein